MTYLGDAFNLPVTLIQKAANSAVTSFIHKVTHYQISKDPFPLLFGRSTVTGQFILTQKESPICDSHWIHICLLAAQ